MARNVWRCDGWFDGPSWQAANIFPLDEANLQELADDIKQHGQKVPIEILEGKLIDGRRRHAACLIAKVTPITRTVEVEDPVAYVLSLNLHRRHLTPSQAGMCAARARGIYETQIKEKERLRKSNVTPANCPESPSGDARDFAGKAFGVSGKTVDRATTVLTKGTPELVAAVDQGRMTVSKASRLAAPPAPKASAASTSTTTANMQATTQTQPKPKPSPPKLLNVGQQLKSERYAMSTADVAIAQLKGIPAGNRHRDRWDDADARKVYSVPGRRRGPNLALANRRRRTARGRCSLRG